MYSTHAPLASRPRGRHRSIVQTEHRHVEEVLTKHVHNWSYRHSSGIAVAVHNTIALVSSGIAVGVLCVCYIILTTVKS